MRSAKLHLGCGPGPQPVDWVHVDGSWNARFSKFNWIRRGLSRLGIIPAEVASYWTPDLIAADVRRPLPFESGLFECVYASHLLEHLYEDEARRLLAECYRVLRPDGILRLVVPDLRGMVERYLTRSVRQPNADASLEPAADLLNEELLLRPRSVGRGHLVFRLYSMATEFHVHKWMYDAESLVHRVQSAGFSSVAERRYLDSGIREIAQIEQAGRVVDGAGICVEGVKS